MKQGGTLMYERIVIVLSVLSVEPYGMKHLERIEALAAAIPFSALGRAVWDETARRRQGHRPTATFSALGRAVWDETLKHGKELIIAAGLSVLSVEPYGMKRRRGWRRRIRCASFSALGRAVWDETGSRRYRPSAK